MAQEIKVKKDAFKDGVAADSRVSMHDRVTVIGTGLADLRKGQTLSLHPVHANKLVEKGFARIKKD